MTYYVRTDGNNSNDGLTNSSGGAWLTVDFAATQVAPGDTVRVQAGTYAEVPNFPVNGSAGNLITFVADGVVTIRGIGLDDNSYLRFIGFVMDTTAAGGSIANATVNVVGTNDFIEFWHNTFQNANFNGIRTAGSTLNNSIVVGNVAHDLGIGNGSGTAFNLNGEQNFVAYNEIFDIDPDAITVTGSDGYILNNYVHDMLEESGAHPDFLQNAKDDVAWSRNLVEGNIKIGAGTANDHVTNLQSDVAWTENIFRRNVWHDLGSGVIGVPANTAGFTYLRYYHNTTARAVADAALATEAGAHTLYGTGINHIRFNNNIERQAWGSSRTSGIRVYQVENGSYTMDYNLAYDPDGSVSFDTAWNNQGHEQSNVDPAFVNYAADDFHLQSGSGARGNAGPLTRTSGTGTGTTFNVASNSGGFFRGPSPYITQYGGALTVGDVITIGTDVRRVVSISGDAITVDSSFTWANDEPVYYGDDTTPDIGAFPYKAFGFDLAATYSLDGTEITVVPNDDDLVRFVVIYLDGVPVDVLNEAPFVSDPGAGTVEARVYPKYASTTLWVVAEAGDCDAPPTNDSAADATVIPSLPYSHTQTCIHFDGTTYSVWYVWTATFDGVVSVFGYGDASVYTPELRSRTGPDPGTLSDWPAGGHGFAENRALQIPVVNGEDYYFEFVPNGGDPTPATLHLSVIAGPTDTVVGAVFVNDDSAGFPAALLDPDTGDVLRFLYPFPNGEAGDILEDGTSLVEDFEAGNLKVYDDAFTLTNTLAQASGSPRIRAQRTLDRFYVGLQENPVQVVTVEADGTYGVDAWTLTGITSILALAANNAGTILYHSDNAVSQPLRRWDLVGEVALSNLAAGVTGYLIPDILVMPDDSVVATFVHNVFGTLELRHYAPDGTLLDTFAQDDTDLPAGTLPRLAYSPASGNVWIWRHTTTPTGFSHFREIRISDGATIREFTRVEYETGVYNGPVTASPVDRFGISFSCPFFVLGELTTPASPGSPGGEPGNPPDGEIGPIAWVEEWEDDV